MVLSTEAVSRAPMDADSDVACRGFSTPLYTEFNPPLGPVNHVSDVTDSAEEDLG